MTKTALHIIETLPEPTRHLFSYWSRFMSDKLTFNHTGSDMHTQGHCKRVLLYALLIGQQAWNTSETELLPLAHAAIFHDTRRLDDGLDVGHGKRAALYYQKFCDTHEEITYCETAYLIMQYHDCDDNIGYDAIRLRCNDDAERVIRLYRIFKDADALDRLRFGPNELDRHFLRTPESVRLISFAQEIIKQTLE